MTPTAGDDETVLEVPASRLGVAIPFVLLALAQVAFSRSTGWRTLGLVETAVFSVVLVSMRRIVRVTREHVRVIHGPIRQKWLLSGVTEVTVEPATKGKSRVRFRSGRHRYHLPALGTADAARVVELLTAAPAP